MDNLSQPCLYKEVIVPTLYNNMFNEIFFKLRPSIVQLEPADRLFLRLESVTLVMLYLRMGTIQICGALIISSAMDDSLDENQLQHTKRSSKWQQ